MRQVQGGFIGSSVVQGSRILAERPDGGKIVRQTPFRFELTVLAKQRHFQFGSTSTVESSLLQLQNAEPSWVQSS